MFQDLPVYFQQLSLVTQMIGHHVLQQQHGNMTLSSVLEAIFYKVDPSDIQIQRNTARAFVKHEIHFKKNLKKVQKWKDALKEVANISGWHLQNR